MATATTWDARPWYHPRAAETKMTELIGQTLGHYRILRELGAGGMGQVYLAEDTQLRRRVALKVLPGALAEDRQYLERFEREATAVAALNHPNIVTIFSIERDAKPPFLTMELVEGETLSDRIPESGMTYSEILDLAIPLADALAAAHEQGIVHRDLKPGNVMVNHEGRVKILDFGLAKRTQDGLEPSSDDEPTMLLTREGAVVGTAPYMSPEQLRGANIDARSDLFSLGIILHEMATGSRPFQGRTSAELISAILRDTPPPVDDLKVEFPQHLGWIIRRCLEKDPEKRCQSAVEVRNELTALREELVSGEVRTRTRSRTVDAGPRGARSRAFLAGGVALVITLMAGIAWWLGRGESGGGDLEPQRIVVLPFESLGAAEDEYFAAGVTEEITSRLAGLQSLRVISRRSAQHYAGSDRPITDIGEELGVDFVLAGSVRWAPGDEETSHVRITPELIEVAGGEQVWSTVFDRSVEDIFGVQTEIAQAVVRELGLELLQPEAEALEQRPTESVEAYRAYVRGIENFQRPTLEERQVAQQMFERAVELDPEYVAAWGELAEVHAWFYIGVDRTPERRKAFEEALEQLRRLAPTGPATRLATGYFLYSVHKDLEGAAAEFSALVDERPHDSEALLALARVQRGLGHADAAIETLVRARELAPKDQRIRSLLALVLLGARRLDEAEAVMDEILAEEPDSVYSYHEKVEMVLARGDVTEARRILDEGPATGRMAFLAMRAMTVDWYDRRFEAILEGLDLAGVDLQQGASRVNFDLHRAQALLRLGRQEEAEARLDGAESAVRSSLEESPDDPFWNSTLGFIHALRGEREEAIERGKRGVELADPQNAWNNMWRTQDLARIYAVVGDANEAVPLLATLLRTQYRKPLMPSHLEMDPVWDPIRDDPGFQALLRDEAAESK